MRRLATLTLLIWLGLVAARAQAATFTVTNTANSGTGSLRQAILNANATADTIKFNIPGAGTHTISPTAALPAMARPVTIDGTSQPGYSGTPLIVLGGGNAGAGVDGLQLTGTGCVVKTLNVRKFSGSGIHLTGAAASGNSVQGCYLGTNPSGTSALPNAHYGVLLDNGAHGNTIGGTVNTGVVNAFVPRNVISGNTLDGVRLTGSDTTGNKVQSNYLGLTAGGSGALANGGDGVALKAGAHGNTIGGSNAFNFFNGNTISGNTGQGVHLTSSTASGNLIEGNTIGLNAAGTSTLANGGDGVLLEAGAHGNTIGGTTSTLRNVIAGNAGDGVHVSGGTCQSNLIEGNTIGTDKNGTAAKANSGRGVHIDSGAHNNTIGGTVAGARNLIAGNHQSGVFLTGAGTKNNVVEGNYVGTTADGTGALGNVTNGVAIGGGAQNNTVGGTAPGTANVIAGNGQSGVHLLGTDTKNNVVEGNTIGLQADKTAALGNGTNGVTIDSKAQGNTIGGSTTAARNLISGNKQAGVALASTSANVVEGNYIGIDATGTNALANHTDGVQVANSSGNVIGGSTAGARNVISGNSEAGVIGGSGNGLALFGGTGLVTQHNLVEGNYIGTKADGVTALPNTGQGVVINSVQNNTIGGTGAGQANVIAFNGQNGIWMLGDTATGNKIRGNSIFSNFSLGIDLSASSEGTIGTPTPNDSGDGDTGPNHLQNFSVLSAANNSGGNTAISGMLNSKANATFTLDFYRSPSADSSGYGEGKTYVGSKSVTTNAGGNATFSASFSSTFSGQAITATATSSGGDTSEFSLAVQATAAAAESVASAADAPSE